jgi:hypothetical protein
MSSPEFAALRPIPGNAVLAKAMLYTDPKTRELAFFLQAMSMQSGGLRAVAEQLVEWFPERCREEESREANMLKFCNAMHSTRGTGEGMKIEERTVILLSTFLIELALNPELSLAEIDAPCFRDLGSALRQFKAAHEKEVFDRFVFTTSGKAIHQTLDDALSLNRMVVVEGNAGAGKSINAETWCAARPGAARYVTLTGITNRTTFFQKVGASIGLATCQRKAQELQIKIEDFFIRSKMMLVIDEAHYLWPQSLRVMTAPELIDWIDTALVNNGVPVALLCTDQFARLKNRVERQTGWTSEQFTRRVFRYKKLETPTREDVEAVTRSLITAVFDERRQRWIGGDQACPADLIEALIQYAREQKTPFSCVAACIDEARKYARDKGRVLVSRADLRLALGSGQIPSDAALSRAFSPAPAECRARAASVAPGDGRKPNKAYVALHPSTELPPFTRNESPAIHAPVLARQAGTVEV